MKKIIIALLAAFAVISSCAKTDYSYDIADGIISEIRDTISGVSISYAFDGVLALLNLSSAVGLSRQYPEAPKWNIGGHSLGGASAAMCLASHPDDFEGLVLLAAYSTKDLSKSGKKVISIYGSNDGVLNMKKYNEYMKNLPEDGVKGKFSGKATLLGKATKRGSSHQDISPSDNR